MFLHQLRRALTFRELLFIPFRRQVVNVTLFSINMSLLRSCIGDGATNEGATARLGEEAT